MEFDYVCGFCGKTNIFDVQLLLQVVHVGGGVAKMIVVCDCL